MTAAEVLAEIQPFGQENTKRMLMRNHGVQEPCFGVKIADLKKIQKRIKKDYRLALDLYDTGNYDAMYLAGLIADDARMTKKDLQRWADKAYGGSLPCTTVASVAAGSPHGWEMGLKWIESKKPQVASAGWATLSGVVALKDDAELDLPAIKNLLSRLEKSIRQAPDAVRYSMNGFLISAGCYIRSLTRLAVRTAESIGPVEADLGNNACQIPFAPDYIRKVEERGILGRKRKTMKC